MTTTTTNTNHNHNRANGAQNGTMKMTQDETTIADKIAKLLAKAESTTPEEAEALVAKAQQLMSRWAIDEAMIDSLRNKKDQPAEQIVEKRIPLKGIYLVAHLSLGHGVGRANNCRTLQSKGDKSNGAIWFIGFESDVKRAEMILTSLLVQGVGALQQYVKTIPDYLPGWERYVMRRSFLQGFAEEVSYRLADAKKAAEVEYVEEKANAGEDAKTVSTSMEVALRDRKQLVNDWMDQRYGKLRSARGGRMQGNYNARSDGRAAGSRADVGSPAVPTSRKALGR